MYVYLNKYHTCISEIITQMYISYMINTYIIKTSINFIRDILHPDWSNVVRSYWMTIFIIKMSVRYITIYQLPLHVPTSIRIISLIIY